jgi:beta-lactamase regulating signal transducer with metallopeptidase domain/predicted  nucleic acid-binding Zn-ribbon protein
MNALTTPWIGTIGWALIHFLWQGLLVGLGVALSLHLLRSARPTSRYAVACLGLLLCLGLPLFGILGHLPSATGSSIPLESAPILVADPPPPPPIRFQAPGLEGSLNDHLAIVVLLWALGAGLLALRFASGLAWVRQLHRARDLALDLAWEPRLRRLAQRLDVFPGVRLKVVSHLESPMTAGLWRPVIFLPAALLTSMPPALVEALLAHELAHVKRHDYLVNLLQSAIEVLLFYHPAVWWISHRIRIEREQICDDLAAGALGEPRRLALALQELDRFQLATPHLAQGAHGGQLMTRIRRLIHPEPRPLAWRALASILGIAAACVACATLAAAHLQQAPKAPTALPAPPAPPRPPRPPKPPKPPAAGDLTYAYVRADGTTSCSGSGQFLRAVKGLKGSRGECFRFQDHGQTYIIEDPAELARIRELFKPMDALGRTMDELGKEMNVHSEKMNALGREMDAAAKQGQPHSKEMEALGKQMGALARELNAQTKRQAAMEHKLDQDKLSEADEKALEKQIHTLEAQIEALEAKMERLGDTMEEQGQKLEEAHKPMEAIGQKMEEAGKPMEEIGQRMEAVGEQMEQEGQKLEAGLKQVIQESLASGKAILAAK